MKTAEDYAVSAWIAHAEITQGLSFDSVIDWGLSEKPTEEEIQPIFIQWVWDNIDSSFWEVNADD